MSKTSSKITDISTNGRESTCQLASAIWADALRVEGRPHAKMQKELATGDWELGNEHGIEFQVPILVAGEQWWDSEKSAAETHLPVPSS